LKLNAEECQQVVLFCIMTTIDLNTLSTATVETIPKLKFELLSRPAYSTDVAPTDYLISGSVKFALRGRRFAEYEEDWISTSKQYISL